MAIVVWTFHTWMKLMVIESKYRDVSLGASLSPPYQQPWGPREPRHWHPPNSTAPKQRHAIVVPYRNREIHLEFFQQFMNAYFHRFFRDIAAFDIWIIEQADDKLFRRSSLVNVGILEGMNYSQNGYWDVLFAMMLIYCQMPLLWGLFHIIIVLSRFSWEVSLNTLTGGYLIENLLVESSVFLQSTGSSSTVCQTSIEDGVEKMMIYIGDWSKTVLLMRRIGGIKKRIYLF